MPFFSELPNENQLPVIRQNQLFQLAGGGGNFSSWLYGGQFSSDKNFDNLAQARINNRMLIPWRESLHPPDPGCTQQYVTADNETQAVMVLDFLWSDFVAGNVEPNLLGISKVLPGTPKRLSRVIPWRHPNKPHLFVKRIAGVQGIKPLGVDVERAITVYAIARVTVVFHQLPYRVLDDDELISNYAGLERARWVRYHEKNISDFITSERGYWKWGADAAQAGQPTPAPLRQYVPKKRITLTWHDVPGAALYGSELSSAPVNLDNGKAHVNQFDFLGYPPETLLFVDYDVRESMTPWDPTQLGLALSFPPLQFDVDLHFDWQDPPAANAAIARGHNVFPQPLLKEWASVTTAAGEKMYSSYDMEKLFVPS